MIIFIQNICFVIVINDLIMLFWKNILIAENNAEFNMNREITTSITLYEKKTHFFFFCCL